MEAAPHIHAQIAASMTDSGIVVDSEHCDCYQALRNPPQTSSRMHQYLNLAQEYLPPSLGGLAPKIADPSTQSLTDMLRVLKFATETYLHAEVSNASVSVPFPVGRGRVDSESFEVRLDAAASALNLELSPPTSGPNDIRWADRTAKRAKRTLYYDSNCHPDDEGFVLAVDFSDAALTARIQVSSCDDGFNYYNVARVLHSTELGGKELFKADDWRERLVAALRSTTALPLQGVAETDRINMLMLLGDAARDARFQDALRDVLGDQYERLIASTKDDGTPAHDPQFFGSACGAHWKWDKDHYYHPFDEFGCVSPGPHPYWGPMIRYHVKEWRDVVRKWLRSAEEKKAEAELAAKEERKQLLKERTQVPLVLGPP
jgi:hypothetical protein